MATFRLVVYDDTTTECFTWGWAAQDIAVATYSYDRITQFELWARHATGGIFILIGVYFSLVYIYRVL